MVFVNLLKIKIVFGIFRHSQNHFGTNRSISANLELFWFISDLFRTKRHLYLIIGRKHGDLIILIGYNTPLITFFNFIYSFAFISFIIIIKMDKNIG